MERSKSGRVGHVCAKGKIQNDQREAQRLAPKSYSKHRKQNKRSKGRIEQIGN